MNRPGCAREREVLRAVARGWRGDGDVAAHASTCDRCAEVRAAAEVLRDRQATLARAARVPSAAAMWWRLDRRARDERARRAQRLAFAVQAVMLAVAAGVGLAIVQIAAPWMQASSGVAVAAWRGTLSSLNAWTQVPPTWTLPMALLMAAWFLLVPAALYLGLADD